MVDQAYNIYTQKAYEGQIAHASEPRVVVSKNADTDLGYGLALTGGVTTNSVKLGHNAGNVFAISLREANHEAAFRPSSLGVTNYVKDETVSSIREGTVNIKITGRAVLVPYSKLNVVTATGAFTGQTAGAGEVLSANVVALETGIVGDIIKARIDIVA